MTTPLIQCLRHIRTLKALERAGLASIEMPASNFLLSDRLSPAQQRALEPALVSYEQACLVLGKLTDATKFFCLCACCALAARYLP